MNKNKYIKDVETIMEEIKQRRGLAKVYEHQAKSKLRHQIESLKTQKDSERANDLGRIELWD